MARWRITGDGLDSAMWHRAVRRCVEALWCSEKLRKQIKVDSFGGMENIGSIFFQRRISAAICALMSAECST